MKIFLNGPKHSTLEERIKYMLSLPLAKRYEMGLAKGKVARALERERGKLYGRSGFKTIQILTLKDVARYKKKKAKMAQKKAK